MVGVSSFVLCQLSSTFLFIYISNGINDNAEEKFLIATWNVNLLFIF